MFRRVLLGQGLDTFLFWGQWNRIGNACTHSTGQQCPSHEIRPLAQVGGAIVAVPLGAPLLLAAAGAVIAGVVLAVTISMESRALAEDPSVEFRELGSRQSADSSLARIVGTHPPEADETYPAWKFAGGESFPYNPHLYADCREAAATIDGKVIGQIMGIEQLYDEEHAELHHFEENLADVDFRSVFRPRPSLCFHRPDGDQLVLPVLVVERRFTRVGVWWRMWDGPPDSAAELGSPYDLHNP